VPAQPGDRLAGGLPRLMVRATDPGLASQRGEALDDFLLVLGDHPGHDGPVPLEALSCVRGGQLRLADASLSRHGTHHRRPARAGELGQRVDQCLAVLPGHGREGNLAADHLSLRRLGRPPGLGRVGCRLRVGAAIRLQPESDVVGSDVAPRQKTLQGGSPRPARTVGDQTLNRADGDGPSTGDTPHRALPFVPEPLQLGGERCRTVHPGQALRPSFRGGRPLRFGHSTTSGPAARSPRAERDTDSVERRRPGRSRVSSRINTFTCASG
jgi:hypothetical protein